MRAKIEKLDNKQTAHARSHSDEALAACDEEEDVERAVDFRLRNLIILGNVLGWMGLLLAIRFLFF